MYKHHEVDLMMLQPAVHLMDDEGGPCKDVSATSIGDTVFSCHARVREVARRT